MSKTLPAMRTLLLGIGGIIFVAVFAGMANAADDQPAFSKYVDAAGNISLPERFATEFVHLGTIAVSPKAGGEVTELHVTYTREADVRAFQRDGHFPDGAMLVKEVRATQADDLPTGHTRFAAGVKVWFVMVKDSQKRFPDNDLWGDGWGWALFEGKDRTKQVATDYQTDCRTCHVPARATDWVYTRCYPLLQKQGGGAEKTSAKDDPPRPNLLAKFPQWKQALELLGDAGRGRKYFDSKTLNTSMTCASCHSFDRRDTLSADGDGLRRAGSSIFAAAHRTNIKNSGTGLAALGANVCVIHFMKGNEPGMTAQELADMNGFLQSGGSADHPSAKNIDYPPKWSLPETLAGGDPRRGAALAAKTCITCHGVDGKDARLIDTGAELEAGGYPEKSRQKLALRIRNPHYEQVQEMPGYTDARLSNAELLDLLAWLTTKN